MPKNVGIVPIPAEYVLDNSITPEELRGRLLLPDGVRVYKFYEDWYRQTFNIMLISDSPVDGATYETSPGCEAPFSCVTFKGNDIIVGIRA